jgi:hypothetical protein
METLMNKISEYWGALGPVAPCVVLFLGGWVLILGFLFDWQWLYPGHYTVRWLPPRILRVMVLLIGIICIACSVVFYVFREELYWF